MAYSARTYPVLTKVVSSRRVAAAGVDIYRGQKLMYDDGDSAYVTQALTGDASDKFAGISMQTVLNASDRLGAAGEVYVEVCDEGEFIAELDTTPSVNDQWNIVYADGDSEKVSLTEGTGYMIGVIKQWTNVSDPLGRTNAVLIKFGAIADTSTGA